MIDDFFTALDKKQAEAEKERKHKNMLYQVQIEGVKYAVEKVTPILEDLKKSFLERGYTVKMTVIEHVYLDFIVKCNEELFSLTVANYRSGNNPPCLGISIKGVLKYVGEIAFDRTFNAFIFKDYLEKKLKEAFLNESQYGTTKN